MHKDRIYDITNLYEAVKINDELIKENKKYKKTLGKIEEYVRNKNFLNLGYWVEDEEGRDVFIDVKNDILNIIKEER